MKAVLQRVSRASVRVDGQTVGSIGSGLLILLGVAQNDSPSNAEKLATKAAELRIFSDPHGRFNLSLLDVQGAALVVSQFTLLADARKGRRPSFVEAAQSEFASPLCDDFVASLRSRRVHVETGIFGAHMEVDLVNDGPVTIVLNTDEWQTSK